MESLSTIDRFRKSITGREGGYAYATGNSGAVADQLAPMLAVAAPPRSDDLVKRAWAVVGKFMTLEPSEEAYIDHIERGEVNPELLFGDDPEAAQRLAGHPSILWKITNVRAHLARQDKKND